MEWLMKVISGSFLILFLWSTVRTARIFRRQRLLRPQTLSLTGLFTGVIYSVYILLLGIPADSLLAVALVAGAAVGWIWAQTTKLKVTPQGVSGRGTLMGFLIWAVLMAGLQLANLVQGFSPSTLILVGALQTAMLLTYNIALARRCIRPKGGAVSEA